MLEDQSSPRPDWREKTLRGVLAGAVQRGEDVATLPLDDFKGNRERDLQYEKDISQAFVEVLDSLKRRFSACNGGDAWEASRQELQDFCERFFLAHILTLRRETRGWVALYLSETDPPKLAQNPYLMEELQEWLEDEHPDLLKKAKQRVDLAKLIEQASPSPH